MSNFEEWLIQLAIAFTIVLGPFMLMGLAFQFSVRPVETTLMLGFAGIFSWFVWWESKPLRKLNNELDAEIKEVEDIVRELEKMLEEIQ